MAFNIPIPAFGDLSPERIDLPNVALGDLAPLRINLPSPTAGDFAIPGLKLPLIGFTEAIPSTLTLDMVGGARVGGNASIVGDPIIANGGILAGGVAGVTYTYVVVGAPSLEQRTSSSQAMGVAAVGGPSMELLTRTASGVVPNRTVQGESARAVYSGTGQVKLLGFPTTGAVSLERRAAAGQTGQNVGTELSARAATGVARGAVYGVAVRGAYRVDSVTGFPIFDQRTATGAAHSAASATYLTAVMNARNNHITEYGNYGFNGYARIGRDYYATGPAGVYLLDGTTDDGAAIPWSVLTGQMDGKDPGLKRLPEVLLGLRNTGQVKVSIHPDDNISYDYYLPAVKLDTIHQHRVVPGKGMRSRYYAIGLSAVANSKVEIDSMQVNMTKTTRRLG